MMKNDISRVSKLKPLFFWEGFPACGLLLTQVVAYFGKDLIIVATKPAVPFKGLEKILNHPIIWLDNANDIYKRKNEFSDRNFVVHTGWGFSGWLKYDAFVKKKNNAKIVVVVDNRFKKNIRQLLGSFYFRCYLKKYFDAAFVPGEQGIALMSFFGMPLDRIYVGNYGAYEGIYNDSVPIIDRGDEFLYVGQLNKRKAIDQLISAFIEYRKKGGNWSLRILGDGELKNICEDVDGVIFEGFTQPHEVSLKMNGSKVLILISRDDHWGTVVCEAAACGMMLLTSKAVGSSFDLIRKNVNGLILNKITNDVLLNSLFYFESLSDDECRHASEVSKGLSVGFNSKAYFSAIRKMMYDLF
jgi:glycosyltransferase involved in cell wall biosynthesis